MKLPSGRMCSFVLDSSIRGEPRLLYSFYPAVNKAQAQDILQEYLAQPGVREKIDAAIAAGVDADAK